MRKFGQPPIDGYIRRKAIDFLLGKKPDHMGVKVDQYFDMTETEMESCHGWVQWAFPIDTVSSYNNQCGNFAKNDPNVLRQYTYGTPLWVMRGKLVDQYLATIGIDLYAGTNVSKFFQVVDSPMNHHMKRISRVMTHLMITGNRKWAVHLYRTLINDLVMVNPSMFDNKTIAYWSSIVLEFDESTRKLL